MSCSAIGKVAHGCSMELSAKTLTNNWVNNFVFFLSLLLTELYLTSFFSLVM
jgi:hypothetical protein